MPSTKPDTNTKPQFAPPSAWVARWIIKHPYFSLAITVHVVMLVLVLNFYQHFLPNTTTPAEKVLAEHYTQESRQQAARQRLDDMEAVKKMLDELTGAAEKTHTLDEDASAAALTGALPESVPNNKQENAETDPLAPEPSTLPSMEEMLSQSKQLLKDVEQVRDQILKQKLDALSDTHNQQASAQGELEQDQSEENNHDENGEQLPPSQEQLAREIADNQMAVRRMFEQIARSEQAKQLGNRMSGAADGGQQGEGQGANNSANGSNQDLGWPSGGLDPNNPLSVESYFNKLASGQSRDLVAAMQTMYNLQGYVANSEELDRQLTRLSDTARNHTGYSRKITTNGTSNNRIVINGWYFIGPFPNPDRINLHTRFPPEIGVDLNAVYVGNSNRLLRWEFIQYDHLPIVPPDFTDFVIYYASTEVYSDISRDVWLEIGSDDQSQLWVNDILVWRGSDEQRPWQENQGRRKVRLKSGRNTLLFRLENGIRHAAFSVIVRAVY